MNESENLPLKTCTNYCLHELQIKKKKNTQHNNRSSLYSLIHSTHIFYASIMCQITTLVAEDTIRQWLTQSRDSE